MKKIIGLVGETGSGKDIFCEYVKKRVSSIFIFRFSQPLTEALGIFFDDIKKEDQQWLVNNLRRRFGKNILGEAIKKKVKNIKKGLIILNGVRMLEEFNMIKNMGGKIIYITAPSELRWQRIRKRGEKKDDSSSYKNFLKLEKAECEILIPKMGKRSDFKIENSGSKEDFYKKIKEILKQIK